MADNVTLNKSSGTFDAASDDVGGVQYQRVKLDIGADGASTPVTDLATSAKQDTGNTSLASIDTKLGGTLTVGSHAVTQSGTWTVQPGNTANTTAWKVDGSAVTQPVSGTVTANAGTNLNTSALALDATLTGGTQKTKLVDSAGTNVATVSAAGAVKVDGSAVTQPVSGSITADTELPAAAALSDTTANPTAPMVGAATMVWDGTQWVRLRNNLGDGSGGGQIGQSGNMVYNGSTWDRVRGDTTGMNTHTTPTTSGGLSIYHLVSAGSTNATNVKASAGQLYGWYIYNSNAAARKVAFHNTSGTPTAGASVAMSVVIPPTSGANVEFANGIAFSSGIGITTVTDLTDAGTTAVGASDLVINLFYK